MPDITEHGFILLDGLNEWGSRKIDGLMAEGRLIIALVVVVETIVAKEFPMGYYESPVKVKELRSKVAGATISRKASNFPHVLVKSGTCAELVSKWS